MDTARDTQHGTEKATFGAGCFWQVEEAFRQLPGVVDTAVGYEGGHVDNPTYEQVCSGTTGHVEVCQVTFDPSKVSSDEQADVARRVIERTQPRFRAPIVTEVTPAKPFWRAEEYHQCYLEKRSSSGLLGTLLGR